MANIKEPVYKIRKMKANSEEYYLKQFKECELRYESLRAFVELVATGKRPDGTYNYCREALEQKAKEVLKECVIYPSKEPSISELLENYEKTLNPEDKVTVGCGEKTIEFYKTGMSEDTINKLTESLEKFINSEESDILNS
jgi:hypothetical protein